MMTAVTALPRHDAAFDVDDLPYARHHSRCHVKNTGWLGFAVGSDDPRHDGRQSQQRTPSYRAAATDYVTDREWLAIELPLLVAAAVAATYCQSGRETLRNSTALPPDTSGTDRILPADPLSCAEPAASARASGSAGASAAPWPGKST